MVKIKLKGISDTGFLDNYNFIFVKDSERYYIIKAYGTYKDDLLYADESQVKYMSTNRKSIIIDVEQVENIEEIRKQFQSKEKPTQKLQENISNMIAYALPSMSIEDTKDIRRFLSDLGLLMSERIRCIEEKEKEAIKKAKVECYNGLTGNIPKEDRDICFFDYINKLIKNSNWKSVDTKQFNDTVAELLKMAKPMGLNIEFIKKRNFDERSK